MVKDPFRGKTFDFVFTDGQMANKTFTHTFGDDGTVTFTMGGTDAKASSKESESEGKDEGSGVQKKPEPVPYTFATLRDGIAAMSYKSAAGYTLTCILDFETGKLVLKVIDRVNRELRTTTAVITHNAPIATMADRVVALADGHIVREFRNTSKATPEELRW